MWVIGNGESRRNIDIQKIAGYKVGCNAIYRDHKVDYLVCVDRRMMDEALRANANQDGTLLYTRPDWYHRYKDSIRVRQLPDLPYNGDERWDEPFQWGSGPYAVLLGAMYSKEREVKLIGFDLHSKTKLVNNIYKGTPNYDDADKRAIDPSYWIHQIGMVFNCFPKTQFTIYQESDWLLPQAWNYPNVMVDRISNIYYNT
jgi:kynurenine formamidase